MSERGGELSPAAPPGGTPPQSSSCAAPGLLPQLAMPAGMFRRLPVHWLQAPSPFQSTAPLFSSTPAALSKGGNAPATLPTTVSQCACLAGWQCCWQRYCASLAALATRPGTIRWVHPALCLWFPCAVLKVQSPGASVCPCGRARRDQCTLHPSCCLLAAVAVVGYNRTANYFIIRNSW